MIVKNEEQLRALGKSLDQDAQVKRTKAERAIKQAVKKYKSPYSDKIGCKIISNGSFRATTSTKRKNDVDLIVCRQDRCVYIASKGIQVNDGINCKDVKALIEEYKEFKSHVGKVLKDYFGSIERKDKVFHIQKEIDSVKLDIDVLAALRCKCYSGVIDVNRLPEYEEGIIFATDGGQWIVNWPRQTFENGAKKQRRTKRRYKKVIRILKNLRNEMRDEGIEQAKEIASFLIESLVWNVPNRLFGNEHYCDDVINVLDYCIKGIDNKAIYDSWHEVNGIKSLFGPDSRWVREQACSFLIAVKNYVRFV